MRRLLGPSLLLLLFVACSGSKSKPDAGETGDDGGGSDAGPADADAPDADAPDADGDAPDGAAPDADALDGSAPDADALDGSAPDADALDGSAPERDASEQDASDGDASDADASDGDAAHDDAGDASEGGALSCDEATYDPVLGTAQLGTEYRVVDSALLPVTSWLPVGAVDEALAGGGVGLAVYGYAGDGRMHRLGVWPQLNAPDGENVVFDAVSTQDRAAQVMTTPMVATTQGLLLASYRTLGGGSFLGGGVSLFDTARPEDGTRWLAAPGVESVLGLGSYFLVGSDGLGNAGGSRGVYGLYTGDPAPSPALVATYPTIPSENVRPGLMAVTPQGLVAMGYYLDGAARHSVRLPEPAQLSAALSGGAPIDLATVPELTQADDVANLVSFSAGVAALHTRKVRGVLPALGRLEYYALSRSGGDAGTVIGAPVTMLSASDEGCTAISQLVPVTGGLSVIVGLWDRNGQRLVRLAPR